MSRLPIRLLFALCLLSSSLLPADTPVPDPIQLMSEVREHQKKIDELRENYTFHRIRRSEELDGKGEVKKVTTEEHEIFFVNGRQVRRLVKRDGQPPPADEAKKEREHARKQTIEFAKKPPSFGRGGGVSMISMVLSVSHLSNPRRVEMNGRPTLAFDFKGNPKAEAHTMQSKGARKLEGTVWIDEVDRQVARLEVEFYETFRVAGGLLASIQEGTVIKMQQSPIGEGLWMLTDNDQRMNLRVIAKRVHQNTRVTNFDFKRFNVDEAEKIGPPVLR